MFKQRHQVEIDSSMATVFSVLLRVLGRSRWASTDEFVEPDRPPRAGCVYLQRKDGATRRGRVVECLPPVTLTLYETLLDPPCRVRLRLRWRLEPADAGCVVLLDARYQLNGAAQLNRRHWRAQIHAHCVNLLSAIRAALEAEADQGDTGVSGQTIGSSSITVRKTTMVNGRPSFK